MISLKTRVFRVCCMLILAISAGAQATPGQPGTLDTTFNGTGKVITHISPGSNFAFAAALQPNGKIVLGGTCQISTQNNTQNNFCALRYNANGSLNAVAVQRGRERSAPGCLQVPWPIQRHQFGTHIFTPSPSQPSATYWL